MKEKPIVQPIYDYSIWLQVSDLPIGFHMEKVCIMIGDFAEKFVESDPQNFDGFCRDFIRIRVILDG